MSFLECNPFYIIINFLVFCSICPSFSFVHFQNDSEYMTRGTTQMFIAQSAGAVEYTDYTSVEG